MKWARVGRSHWNTDRINAFTWSDGRLAVWWCDQDESPETYHDPSMTMYKQLCTALGVSPFEEE